MRFIVVQEPTDTWAVFDTALDEPADFTGKCLIGLTRDSAKWFAARCNQEASRRGGQRNQTAVVAPACLRIRLAFAPIHGDEMFDASLHVIGAPPTVNGGNTSGFLVNEIA